MQATVQCSGIAKTTDLRCKRTIASSACAGSDFYCLQHADQEPRRPRRNQSKWSRFWHGILCMCGDGYDDDEYDNYNEVERGIPIPLASVGVPAVSVAVRDKNRALLQRELRKPVSAADEPGFIYIYQLATNLSASKSLIKVGRSKNVHRRLHQWAQQCSHMLVLAAIVPDPGLPPCRASRRAERLVHLELRSLFVSSALMANVAPDCACQGRMHVEWFAVQQDQIDQVVSVIRKWVCHVGSGPAAFADAAVTA
ncbi:meiotically up-regulated gene 113-domain-containing protein [Lipomyces japonicus]|uniref:meiotically up-regulated gene 113-domain-containing protein n=1 Tax=Lipomyces japonicus TaxID=56871 RepID=UPI0034CF9703